MVQLYHRISWLAPLTFEIIYRVLLTFPVATHPWPLSETTDSIWVQPSSHCFYFLIFVQWFIEGTGKWWLDWVFVYLDWIGSYFSWVLYCWRFEWYFWQDWTVGRSGQSYVLHPYAPSILGSSSDFLIIGALSALPAIVPSVGPSAVLSMLSEQRFPCCRGVPFVHYSINPVKSFIIHHFFHRL